MTCGRKNMDGIGIGCLVEKRDDVPELTERVEVVKVQLAKTNWISVNILSALRRKPRISRTPLVFREIIR